MPTCRLSWKVEAWYWAYLAMMVCERLLSQGHVWLAPLASQFSSAGCLTWVLTSTAWSELASTRDLVENRPRSAMEKETEKDNYQIITKTKFFSPVQLLRPVLPCKWIQSGNHRRVVAKPSIAVENTCFAFKCERWSRKCQIRLD